MNPATGADPSRSLEIERKYDVDADADVPDWTGVDAIDRIGPAEHRALDAQYFDTADLSLARAGVALRRRTGGPDEGWHIKGPREGDGRMEFGWPLGEDNTPPTAVREAIARWTTAPLTPLARIENDRVAYALERAGEAVAEFVDDHVRATDLRTGVRKAWREWELELSSSASADTDWRAGFFAAAEQRIFAAGGRVAASDSKIARALGK